MKAIIIGAGVIGTSVAYRLAEAGVAVTVIEKNYIGSGTSGASFAWINANRKPPRPYYDLNCAGMLAHAALNEELDGDWFRVTGNVEWFHSDEDLEIQRQRVNRLLDWGYDAQWIDSKQLGELEPDIDLHVVGDGPIAFFPKEGLADPVRYAGKLLSIAQRRWNVELKMGVSISDVTLKGGRVVSAQSEDGTTFEADIIINCTGRWVNDVVGSEHALKIPMAPTVGLLAFTPPVPSTLSRPIHAPDVNIRPDGSGRLMMRSNVGDDSVTLETPRDPRSPIVLRIMQDAAKLLPCLGDAVPEAVRITLRSIPEDDISAVGKIPGVEGYYVCVTHSGVTLAPALGQAVADEITNNRSELALDIFRPERFYVAA
jgi:glycine/D-amino acid oxidase-like deaminating enzyme